MDETNTTVDESVEQKITPNASVDVDNSSHEEMRQKSLVTTIAALVIMIIMIFFYIYFVGYIRQDVPDIVPLEKTPEQMLIEDLQKDEQTAELEAGEKSALLQGLNATATKEAELTPDEREELFNNL